MLYQPCWDNIGYCLVNVIQTCLRQHCTRKLFAQCWPRAHRYTFAVKPAVWNKSGNLLFNQAQYHQTILALSVQCCLGSPFMACRITVNRDQHWLGHRFPICFNIFVSFSCNSMPWGCCSALHGVNPNLKNLFVIIPDLSTQLLPYINSKPVCNYPNFCFTKKIKTIPNHSSHLSLQSNLNNLLK